MKLLLKTLALTSCFLAFACTSATGDDGVKGDGDGDVGDGDGVVGDGDGVVGDGDGVVGDGDSNPPLVNGPTTDALETVDPMYWVSYDGNEVPSLVWEIKDDGTGNTIVHAKTSGTPELSASVSLSIPQAELTDDMARSKGVRFNVSGTGTLLFQAQSGAVIPTSAGGWCDAAVVTTCWNAHEQSITLGAEYQTVEILWDDLFQSYGTDTNPVALYPEEILLLSFILPGGSAGEYFLDSIELIANDGTGPKSGIEALISKTQFNAILGTGHLPVYSYEGFVAAAQSFPAFGGDADPAWAKREIAMFLANAKWETGYFKHVEEENTANYGTYCDYARAYGCPAGQAAYYGRGAMQLSWNYNYKDAGDYLGIDLLNNPQQVATDPTLAWRTALWFWMGPGRPGTCHAVFKSGLGATIDAINGLECNGGYPDGVNGRLLNYRNILGPEILNLDPLGTDNGC